VEESIERAKRSDSQKAAESHLRLKQQMDFKERQRSELLETLNVEAEAAKLRLEKIQEEVKIKSSRYNSNIRKRSENIRENMFAK